MSGMPRTRHWQDHVLPEWIRGPCSSRAATLPVSQQCFCFVEGTGNDMSGDEFSDAAGGIRTGFSRRLDGPNIAADKHGHIPIEEIFAAHENDVCGLHHRVGSLDSAN